MTISVLNRNEIGAIWPGAPHFLGSRCQNAADRSVALTAYKSYSFPADDLGAFAVSHANVWRCGLKVTPVPGRFRLHPRFHTSAAGSCSCAAASLPISP